MHRLKRFCRHIHPYIYPSILLVALGIVVWYFFIYLEIVSSTEKRITSIITILGLGLGVFQFWVSELNVKRRREFDLKYNAYKEIILLVESFAELISKSMLSKEVFEIHGLVSESMTQVNRLISTMKINNDHLFPGITNSEESNKIKGIFRKILNRTDQFRIFIEKTTDENEVKPERLRWHNDVNEQLKELHESKYDFYKIIQSYF